MTTLRPTLPVSVPAAAEGGGVSAEVTVSTISDSSALDTKPDARRNPPQAESAPQTQGQGQSAPEPKDQKKNNGRNNKKSPGK